MTRPINANGNQLIRPYQTESDVPCAAVAPVSVLDLVSACHANVAGSRPRKVVIEFQPMLHIARVCSSIFSSVDREDPLQREAARDAWLVKSSLALTALPFDDPRLGVDELLDRLQHASVSIPGIRTAVDDLARAVGQLVSGAANPKRDALLTLLHESMCSDLPLAVLANVCGSPTPGWPASIDPESDFGLAALKLIRRRRQTRDSLYARLIIPGNPWFAPRSLLFDLLYGGRTSDVVVVGYRSEHTSLPVPKELPRNHFFQLTTGNPRQTQEPEEFSECVQADDKWAHESLWASIHAQHGDLTPISDSDVTVDAKFVLFADGSGTFLPAYGRVVEVSDLFETGDKFDITEDKLPRTPVRDLNEGDLVMLRLSGSGDYLDDVADTLMRQTGEAGLRRSALQWKERLEQAIKRHGEGVVAMNMRGLGVRLRSPQYLWEWAGDAVMAPHDRQTFLHLIATTWQLEGLGVDDVSEIYANARWDEMERLKAYHHKAGAVIRAALLARVRELVAERRHIETVESIELPGAAAGRMGLLRVAAIDTKTRRVPTSTLLHLTKVKVTPWQG